MAQRYGRIVIFSLFLSLTNFSIGQIKQDSSKSSFVYSGNLSYTNNGFSIIPTFSFNSPAINTQMSWKKKDFSIEPDIRVAPDLTKGSMLLWFRYALVKKSNFSLRVGVHPAMNWFPKKITENAIESELYQLRRFFAWELAPNVKINEHNSSLQMDSLKSTLQLQRLLYKIKMPLLLFHQTKNKCLVHVSSLLF